MFKYLYAFFSRFRLQVAVVLLVSLVAGLAGLKFIPFDNNIETMLPRDDEVRKTLGFFRDSNLSDKIILSLSLTSEERTTRDLIAQVDRLAESLESEMVKRVVTGISTDEMSDIWGSGILPLDYVAQLADGRALREIEEQLAPEMIEKQLRRLYKQLIMPAGSFLAPIFQSDPLGIKLKFLKRFEQLNSSFEYKVSIKDGHFLSADDRNALLIIETPVAVTDGFRARELMDHIKDKLDKLPDFISSRTVAGHLHTISNEDILKRDIRLTSVFASVGFLLLFLLYFRDLRAILVFLIPPFSILLAANISILFFDKLSYFIIGLGTVIAGISIDYGIFVYVAMSRGEDAAGVLGRIAKPVVVGSLTTVSAFAAFLFSDVEGYHQLAVFSSISLFLCLFLSLFALPHAIEYGQSRRRLPGLSSRRPTFARISDRLVTLAWGALMVVALMLSSGITLESDILQFDGADKSILAAEREFHQTWGGRESPGIFVIEGPELEALLKINEEVYRDAASMAGADKFISLAPFWPSATTRAANASAWRRFWEDGGATRLKELLERYGGDHNFAPGAFSLFFEQLEQAPVTGAEPNTPLWKNIRERFVSERRGGYQVISFFPDKEPYIGELTKLASKHPGAFVASRSTLSSHISRSIFSRISLCFVIATLMTLGLMVVLLKDFRLVLLALVPILTGFLTIFSTLKLLGLTLGPPGMVACMVAMGIVSDYGIFMAYDCTRDLRAGTHLAVFLAALSTLLGAGVLLIANHPVLYSIGVTMVAGIVSGYISAVIVVPALFRLFGLGREGWLLRSTV